MFAVVLAGVILSPLLVLFTALFRALFLFWPTMLMFGAVHSYIFLVPALGWQATFFVVALLSLLIPTSGVSTNTSSK